jgi:predicted nicotinamide N-methyase
VIPHPDIPSTLQAQLHSVLPGAELALQRIDSAVPLQLLLIRDALASRQLDPQTAQRVMDNPLYWMFCWASGQVLAAYLLEHPQLVLGRRVLDFGCGSGVVAIAAAKAGAGEVIACDIDPLALEATRFNAAANDVALTLSSDFDAVSGPIDLVLVADVLYDRGNLPWLDRLLARAGEVWVADSRVRDFERPPYVKIGERDSCTVPDMDEAREFNRVSIYRGCAGRQN